MKNTLILFKELCILKIKEKLWTGMWGGEGVHYDEEKRKKKTTLIIMSKSHSRTVNTF